MQIPNADAAFVDIAKLRDYCLDEDHPCGKHKARVFKRVLGLTKDDAWVLRQRILDSVKERKDATIGTQDSYGDRYVLDIEIDGPNGPGQVRTAWIVRIDEDFPRLVSCYVVI